MRSLESDTTERLHFHFPALEKEMATHSSVLDWRIPGMGEPGGLQAVGSQRVGHDRELTHTHTKLLMIQIMSSFFLVTSVTIFQEYTVN